MEGCISVVDIFVVLKVDAALDFFYSLGLEDLFLGKGVLFKL